MNSAVKTVPAASSSVLVRMGQRYGVDPEKMLATLKATAFRGDVTHEQMMSLLVVADQYDLNPWTRELFAFPAKGGGIVPVVSVDGWSRIINSHPAFNGLEFVDGEMNVDSIPAWIECIIYRRDREHPTKTREYFQECNRGTEPWKTHPRRMLRHKALIQCARLAFSFAGIYDQDEGERIAEIMPAKDYGPRPEMKDVDQQAVSKWVSDIADILAQDKEEWAIASDLREADQHLQAFDALYVAVFDRLAKDGIISKKGYKDYLKIQAPAL